MQTVWFKIIEEQSLPNGLPCLWRCFIEFIGAISFITDKSNLNSDGRYQCWLQSPDRDENNKLIISLEEWYKWCYIPNITLKSAPNWQDQV